MSMEPDALAEKIRQWALLKQQSDTVTKRLNHLRDEIMDVVVRDGDRDEKGNTYLPLAAGLEVAGKTYKGVKREARKSTVLNEERALEFARDNQLWDSVVQMTPSIDLDALYAAYQDERISEEQLDGLFDTKTSHAFKPDTA